ncbi:MAG: hypothetical protein QM626_02485 [Microbacterium sp.]|uniref:hypothetical protein n=1 Tax=Microbacterium sp. TaxID=51671 RepID=UPI0039E27164
MSHPARPAHHIEVRSAAECMCHAGGRCTSYDPGHALHLVQARLAAATPAEWRDAFVVAIDDDAVTLRWASTGAQTTFANASGATNVVQVGEPVAVHDRYRVLAVGRRRFNVREVG